MVDTSGLLYKGRTENMNYMKDMLVEITNKQMYKGDLNTAVEGADVLIGASTKGAFSIDLIKKMAEKPIVFALANPEPEIEYDEALAAGAFIVATGRSDTPNQVNNLSAFPGVLRGILEVRAKSIDDYMLLRAAKVIAKSVGNKLSTEFIMPDLTDSKTANRLAANVAAEIAEAAMKQGLARIEVSPEDVRNSVKASLKRYNKIERVASK